MNIVIVGASGGIGSALVEHLSTWETVRNLNGTYHRNPPPYSHDKCVYHPLDITQESSIQAWSESLGEIDWLINAVGMLHSSDARPEKSIREVTARFYLDNMALNALSTLLIARYTQDMFRHGRPAVFASISARVGSIADNRLGGWYSYRASKAALNMGLKTLATEWRRTLPNVVVAALHPGTTDTALSKPFQSNVPEDKLFTADKSAACLLDVLAGLAPGDSGRFWAYDGKEIPW